MFGGSFSNRLIDGFTMFIVTAASLMLLLYVGYGDSKRTYEQIHIEKITTNGQLVQNSIEKFLRDGLPLRQYAGFSTIAAPVLEVEGEDVDSLMVYRPDRKSDFLGCRQDESQAAQAAQRRFKGEARDYGRIW